MIVESTLTVDHEVISVWNASGVDRVRDRLSVRPPAVAFDQGESITTGYEQCLLSVASYASRNHAEV
ncbi:hypothetical protein [Streptomyces noursei]|uniref:hypothetical protein n=1 Tax=Streptomyces noursei TaxID=1971 RepID=UPI0037F7AF75